MKVSEIFNSQRSKLSYRVRLDSELKKGGVPPLSALQLPSCNGAFRIQFFNRLFRLPARYEFSNEETFTGALRKLVDSGRTCIVRLSIDTGIKSGVKLRVAMSEGELITSVSAAATCSGGVTVNFSKLVAYHSACSNNFSENERSERDTCIASLELLALYERLATRFPGVAIERGPSNILSSPALLRDVMRVAAKYGVSIGDRSEGAG